MSDIILYGRGKTGQCLMKMTKRLGKSAVFFDDEQGFSDDARFSSNSLVVTSPGVKPFAKGLQAAKKAGAEVVGELEYCFPFCKGKCVSVTGTNGKTTVCELIYHILQKAKFPSRLLGNGGVPLSAEVLDISPQETVVLESSSFQLDSAKSFSPYISVLTNIAPDHLDYHGSYSEYVRAKKNNFIHQKSTAFAIFNADDNAALELSTECPSYTLYYSTKNPNANCYYFDGALHLNLCGKESLFTWDYPKTLVMHNLSNVLCAVLVCTLLGVEVSTSCRLAESYKFLPHRLQLISRFDGVGFVDDSKATNVHATVSALHCYENTPLAMILGGSDKNCCFDEIFTEMKSNVKLVCAVGETAEKIKSTGARYSVQVKVFPDLKQALYACYERIKKVGGIVLMSNACASFDMFDGYAQRGNYFAKLVEELCRDEKKV